MIDSALAGLQVRWAAVVYAPSDQLPMLCIRVHWGFPSAV